MKQSRFIWALLILFLTALPVRPVAAHALPVQSIPEANAQLDNAPAQVEIFFSEAVEASFSSIEVYDTQGNQVDNGDSRLDPADPRRLTVTIRSVPDGVYTVVWNVLSTVDGHITAGSFPFAVGNVDPAALAAAGEASQTYTISPFDIAARWLIFLSSSVFIGGIVFQLMVWARINPSDALQARLQPIWKRLNFTAVMAFIIGNVLVLMVQAGKASGAELTWPWSEQAADLLITTRGGILILSRLLFAVVLAAIYAGRLACRSQWIGLVVALLALLSISLSSHSAALEDNLLPVLLDWIHLTGAGIWIGGLAFFAVVLWSLRGIKAGERTEIASRLIPRFSIIAFPTVVVLALTGLYSAVVNVGSLDNIFSTLYGETLAVKVLLVLPMVALGAVNLLLITGRMGRAAEDKSATEHPILQWFRRTVSTELALGVTLLLVVSVLTTVPPAEVAAEAPALSASSEADDLTITLETTPGRVGINTFLVTVKDDGSPVDDALEVSLNFTPTSANIPPAETELENVGNGQYQIDGSYFSLPDVWQVQASVRRQDAFDAFANLSFPVGVAESQTLDLSWSIVAGVILLLMALGYMLAWQSLARSRRQGMLLTGTTCLALLVASAWVFSRPDTTAQGLPINPIAPNADSIAAGEELYQANCVPCHGISGKGDGPVGLTLNPPPADLTIHTAPGVHPDGQLFVWISDGFPGATAMPAFRSALTDEDRWNLVNYLRTLDSTN